MVFVCTALITAAALMAIVVIVISDLWYKSVYVDTKPHEFMLRTGDTVDCGEAHWTRVKRWHVQEKVLVEYGDHESKIQLKRVRETELDTLREKRIERLWDNNFTVSSETHFTIPRGYYKLPYLMSGSNITVSICLQSNTTIPNNAHLYIFNDSFTVFNFLNNKTNGSTHDAVFNTPLEVGAKGKKPQCHHKVYTVTSSAYYHVALEVAIGVTVIENITLDVVYINGSKLTQVEPCVVDRRKSCFVSLKLQITETQTLFCYAPKVGIHTRTHVLVTEIPCLKNLWIKNLNVLIFPGFLLLCFVCAMIGFVTVVIIIKSMTIKLH